MRIIGCSVLNSLALRPRSDFAHHLFFDDVLVAFSHASRETAGPPICGAPKVSSPARLNVEPGPNASPEMPRSFVGRSIRSLLAVNTVLKPRLGH